MAVGLAAVLSDGLDPAKAREWDLYVFRAYLLVGFGNHMQSLPR